MARNETKLTAQNIHNAAAHLGLKCVRMISRSTIIMSSRTGMPTMNSTLSTPMSVRYWASGNKWAENGNPKNTAATVDIQIIAKTIMRNMPII